MKDVLALGDARIAALAAACCDGALFRTRDWFRGGAVMEGLPVLESGIRELWRRAGAPMDPSPVPAGLIRELHDLYPDEDDASAPRGWGEIVSAVTLACEIANGHSLDSLPDCLSYAYQAVMEMAVCVEAKKAMTTGAALRSFEEQSPSCLAELDYQLAALATLESGARVFSSLFPGTGA